jgi:hypothetical protein
MMVKYDRGKRDQKGGPLPASPQITSAFLAPTELRHQSDSFLVEIGGSWSNLSQFEPDGSFSRVTRIFLFYSKKKSGKEESWC